MPGGAVRPASLSPLYGERLSSGDALVAMNVMNGLPWKRPVRVATTGNVTISTALNSGDTIDGITLADGDRVLVKDQSTASQNGIYIAGTTPARTADFDSSAEILGAIVPVMDGTVNAGRLYRNTNTATITVDTDDIDFERWGLVSPLTTKGDLWGYSTADARLPVGTDGYPLVADSSASLGLSYGPMSAALLYPFHDEPLTDGASNFIFAAGDIVVVTGVPNP